MIQNYADPCAPIPQPPKKGFANLAEVQRYIIELAGRGLLTMVHVERHADGGPIAVVEEVASININHDGYLQLETADFKALDELVAQSVLARSN